MAREHPSPRAVEDTLREASHLCVFAYEVAELPIDSVEPEARFEPDPEVVRRVARDPLSVLPILVVPTGKGWRIYRGDHEYHAIRAAGHQAIWAVIAHECYGVSRTPFRSDWEDWIESEEAPPGELEVDPEGIEWEE